MASTKHFAFRVRFSELEPSIPAEALTTHRKPLSLNLAHLTRWWWVGQEVQNDEREGMERMDRFKLHPGLRSLL